LRTLSSASDEVKVNTQPDDPPSNLPPAADFRFRRKLHLRTQADFDRVYASKVYAADDMLVLNACASELPHPRLGLSVSRKVGKAVVRNRWKRLIRESFRLSQHLLPAGIDLVVRPQRDAEPELAAISRSLPALAQRVARRIGGSKGRPNA
jgi:ribonuclease P protein component